MLDGARYLFKAGQAILSDPVEGFERSRERLLERRASRQPPSRLEALATWHRELHRRLGLTWPCGVEAEFAEVWSEVTRTMADQQLTLGKGTFGGWDDGDPALSRAVYCLSRHLRPRKVLETGVARGVSTRFILEALERNGAGALFSIDLPPLIDSQLESEVALVVPDDLRGRWTYVKGSSRRRLREVLGRLEAVDFFLHDSMHTERNVRFELDHVWPVLSGHGGMVVDDVDYNRGLESFLGAHPALPSPLVCAHEQGRRLFAVVLNDR
jgi:hypothetical protein